ncbi:MAG: TIR domain-containing protein [Lachnospiraceae bacterium]|nr:TIR domain-containing protein [Lachnospiraceae bacterium]
MNHLYPVRMAGNRRNLVRLAGPDGSEPNEPCLTGSTEISMSKEYSAFISYRHAPADISVASEIQKRLERYPVPAAIRKKTGKAKIGRIFRDKEELPITSDLNEDITEALENADYLIVICSTSTKESMWVEREIRTFLKNHSKKEILTVLVNGEPYEVIPEVLLTDTVERTAPDGTVYEETINYEPLSCDFRAGIKTARRTEIPRLAAALLGCKYDELVMRERQYRRRRLTAILGTTGTLAAIALAYLIWSRAEIKKNYDLAQYNYELSEKNYQLAQDNYEEAQRNYDQALLKQSEYLSSKSQDLLDDGDRLRAIELAMEALPSEENDRPLSQRAQEALTVALNAYMPPETADRQNVMAEIAEYRMNGLLVRIDRTDNGKYFLALDSYGILYVWDVESAEKVFELHTAGVRSAAEENAEEPPAAQESGAAGMLEQLKKILEEHGDELSEEDRNTLEDAIRALTDSIENIADLVGPSSGLESYAPDMLYQYGMRLGNTAVQDYGILSDETVAVKTSAGIFAFNFLTGEEVWRYENKDVFWYNARIRTMPGSNTIYVVWNHFTSATEEQPLECILHVAALNAQNGEVTAESSLDINWDSTAYIYGSAVSEDGNIFAFAAGKNLNEISYGSIFIFDKESGQIREILTGERFSGIHAMRFYDAAHFVVAGYPEYSTYSAGGSVGVLGLSTTIEDFTVNVFCVDAQRGEIIWDNSFSSPQINSMPQSQGLLETEVNDETQIACIYANKMALFSADSGEKQDEVEFTGSVVRCGISSRNRVVCYLENGNIGIYDPEQKGEETEVTFFGFDNYGMLSVPHSEEDSTAQYLVVAEPNTIRLYDAVYDRDFVPFENADISKDVSVNDADITGDCLVILGNDAAVYFLSLDGQTPLRKTELPGDPNQYEYIGKDDEHGIVWIQDETDSENDLLRVDVSDGTITPVTAANGAYATWRIQKDGRLSFMSRKTVTVLDTSDKNAAEPERVMTVKVGDVNRRFFVDPSGTKIVVSKEDLSAESGYRVFVTDAATEEQRELEASLQDIVRLADWNAAENRMAITDGYNVCLFDGDGIPITELSEAGERVVSFTFYEDSLIVLYSGGHLTRYNEQTGALKGRTVIRHYASEPFIEDTKWSFGEDTLYLRRKDTIHSVLSFIDLETWEESAATSYMFGYDAARDRIICYGEDPETGEKHLGYFEHYTVDDLLRKGKEALRGFSMADEERASFGL